MKVLTLALLLSLHVGTLTPQKPLRQPTSQLSKRAKGGLSYANAAYARAADAASVADAIDRDVELLDSGDRSDMDRVLSAAAPFTARLWVITPRSAPV